MVDSSEKCTRHDLEGQISKCSDVFLLLHAQSIYINPSLTESAITILFKWRHGTVLKFTVPFFMLPTNTI